MVRNQVRVQVRYEVTTCRTSQTDHTKSHSNYIKNKPKRPITAKNIQPSTLVVTIIQIRQEINDKIRKNLSASKKHTTK